MARHASPFEASPSPPHPQPLTKRDVRRNRIMEKLQGMVDSFSSNQHQYYRAQLQAVQVDMTLVLRADPYSAAAGTGGEEGSGLLDDGGEEIRQAVESMGASLPADEAAQRDYWALAGSRYREFVREVNDCVEQRDADLTALHNHYNSSVKELERLTQQKLHQAEEEHKALEKTIRQRLIASVSRRRANLLKDKEQLDIADSNALLLHPNHFSINNPGSPGNGAQNRKTRHLRHRAGSPNPGDLLENNGKRKRKVGAMEDEGNESPVPGFKPLPAPDALGGGRSPFRDAREKNVYTQFEAPAHSLERIFTEKELAAATNAAQDATWKYFNQPRSQQEHGSNGNDTAVSSVNGELLDNGDGNETIAATTEGTNGSPPPAAPEMERSTSHQVLTRGGAKANPSAALAFLADVAESETRAAPLLGKDPFAPVVPHQHPVNRAEKSGAPAPPGVSHLDIDNDFAMMRQISAPRHATGTDLPDADDFDEQDEENAKTMRLRLLDQALAQPGVSQPYRLPLMETGPAVIGRGVERIPGSGFAPVMSVEQRSMIRQAAGAGAAGSAMAAALQGRIGGGEPMSRTTSAGGASEVAEPRPVRGRGRQMV